MYNGKKGEIEGLQVDNEDPSTSHHTRSTTMDHTASGFSSFNPIISLLTVLSISDVIPVFVRPPDEKYKCAFCNGIIRPHAMQTECGHRLCAHCVDGLFDGNDTARCLGDEDCGVISRSNVYPDVATTKELLRMKVHCSFKDNGCKETVKWSTLQAHEQTCAHAQAKCHNPGCETTMIRSQLQTHELQCDYYPVQCDVCDEYIPQIELSNEHKQICKPKPKNCMFSHLGCTFIGTPIELKQHSIESSSEHENLLISTTSHIYKEHSDVKQQLTEVLSQIANLQSVIDGLQLDTNNNKVQDLQKAFAKLKTEIINIDRKLNEKVDKNQLALYTNKLEEIQNVTSMQESRLSYLEQGNGAASNDQTIQTVRQLETTMGAYDVRLAEYDIRFRLLETAGYDGKLIWKINNYERRKRDAMDGRTLSLYSQPFYTAPYGYKMCARVYLHGDGMGRGSHMSLFFVIMKGEYDALLKWPFRSKVTLSLLDQSGDRRNIKDTFRPDPTSTSFRRPAGDMNIASGSPMFAPHSKVESASYLTDDTIFISVDVDKSELEDVT